MRLPRFTRNDTSMWKRGLAPFLNGQCQALTLLNFKDNNAGDVFLFEHVVERGEIFGQ